MHFGIISPPSPGHIYPHCSFAQKLTKAGHKVTVFNIPDFEELVLKFNLNFIPVAASNYPLGSWNNTWKPAMRGSSLWKNSRVLKAHMNISQSMLDELPELIESCGIGMLIVDQLQPQGASIAQKTNIPFITISSILPLNRDKTGTVPSGVANWLPKPNALNRWRNRVSHTIVSLLSIPYLKLVNKQRKKWGLTKHKHLEDTFSEKLQFCLFPKRLDFPRPAIQNFWSVGPTINDRETVDFPWDIIGDSKVVYVSFGTIRNEITKLMDNVLAVAKLNPNVQFIISKGKWNGNNITHDCPFDNTYIFNYIPQQQVLERVNLCITHAGAGTTIECATIGVPMLAIPIADDQPSVASRIKYHNLGGVIPLKKVGVKKLNSELNRILGNKEISNNAKKMSSLLIESAMKDSEVLSLIEKN